MRRRLWLAVPLLLLGSGARAENDAQTREAIGRCFKAANRHTAWRRP
jgi:hypothetical protein